MMYWIWTIPWVFILIFSAGWIFGKKFSEKRCNAKFYKEQFECDERRRMDADAERMYKKIVDINNRVSDLEHNFNKEDNCNG